MDLNGLSKRWISIHARIVDAKTGTEQVQELGKVLHLSDDDDFRAPISRLCQEIRDDIEDQLDREAHDWAVDDEQDDEQDDDETCEDCAAGDCHGADPEYCECDRHDTSRRR